jgi:diguanylate cyclase (GGDEF)-like protein
MNQESLQTELTSLLEQVHDNPNAALLQAEKSILWAGRNGWINILALANLVAGWAHVHQHIYENAVENFQRANTLFKDLADPEFVAKGYQGLGSTYMSIGEYSLAIEHYRKAISWLNRLETKSSLTLNIRMALAHALMNLNFWSDAEQELLAMNELASFEDVELADYQMMVLRLAFYRGDQRTVREQLQLCRELVLSVAVPRLTMALEYYSARYVTKYEKVKQGEAQLADLWRRAEKDSGSMYYLAYEAALDLLQSDYPQKGIHWLSLLLEEDRVPLPMQQQIHLSLAHFFVAHLSHELATEHYQAAEKLGFAIRENEVNQQWARYQADEAHQNLRNQIAQHKRNNQILAESNALLQAVNRIALAVNSALDQESLLKRLREQLVGWIDTEVVAIAELKNEALHFDCILEGEKRLPEDIMPLTEDRAWSVRSVKEGRILYENDFVLTNEISMAHSPNMVRSVSFTPLKCENRVIGLLTLQSRRPNMFDTRAVSLLEYISPVIGIAFASLIHLERTRELSGELNKQQKELNDVRQLMAHLSDHDEYTGLPNRSSLPEHFERWRQEAPFHCLALKINNLDEVNNVVGFGSDEEIIKVLAQRLRNRVRPDDLLIRAGSDQFLLIVENMSDRDNLFDFAQQLLLLTTQPLRAKDQTVGADVSIGIVQYPAHGETLEEIMSMVSVALSHAVEDPTSIFCIE